MRGTPASLLLLTLAALGGCKSAPAPLTEADKATARGMDSAFAVAASAGSVEGMMAGYAPDAMVMPPNMPMAHGTDQIRALWAGMASQKDTLQLTQETADGSGDFMYTTGRYHYQAAAPEGAAAPQAPPAEDGKYLLVYHRGADGKWMVVADTWSANAPPAPPAAPAKPAAARRAQ
jgi:ketosteroid isomerase-like protein